LDAENERRETELLLRMSRIRLGIRRCPRRRSGCRDRDSALYVVLSSWTLARTMEAPRSVIGRNFRTNRNSPVWREARFLSMVMSTFLAY